MCFVLEWSELYWNFSILNKDISDNHKHVIKSFPVGENAISVRKNIWLFE